MKKPLVYLACPYSDPQMSVQQFRFEMANRMAAHLMKKGYFVFSPISMCHPIAVQCGLPGSFDFWADLDRAFLSCCNKMVVLQLPGWKDSKGIKAEIKIADEFKIDIEFISEEKIQAAE